MGGESLPDGDCGAGAATPLSYDPFDYALHEDPYPTYAWMREHAPFYRNEERDFWALSRYADVLNALRNPSLFSSRNGVSLEPELWGPDAFKTSSFLAMDPPEHGAMRRLLGNAFKPRWVASMEPRIRALARARLEPLRDGQSFDFAADFAAALPNDVMCELVGIPAADWDLIGAENDRLGRCEDATDQRSPAAVDAGMRLAMYYVMLVNDRRKHTRDDLISALTQARVDGRPLTDAELVAFLFLMVSATNESTGKLIGTALYHGWRLPEVQRAGLNGRAADWGRETLRFDPPTQMTARQLTEETVIHGTKMPEGARIALLPASANRDRLVFPEPDAFILDRDTSREVSFGHGPHYCPGAALARAEITVALEEIGALVAEYDVDVDRAQWVHSPHQRGFASLPCSVTLRSRVRR
jgi:cytochrome P450